MDVVVNDQPLPRTNQALLLDVPIISEGGALAPDVYDVPTILNIQSIAAR
jgi:hypothetical protein